MPSIASEPRAGRGLRLVLTALLTLPIVVPAAAVAEAAADAPAARTERTLVRSELYFAAIDRRQWDRFLADTVTPRFPEGLTWLDVHGQWREPGGRIGKLPSRLLIILHADSPANETALDEIAERFRQRHHTAVLRASAPVRASDPDWDAERLRAPQLAAPQDAPTLPR